MKASGAAPLCLGGKDPFTTVELFENVLLSTIGATGWRDMVADRLDWRGAQVRAALRAFGQMLSYADPQAGGLTWDQATKKLAAGGCAFESMNDSALRRAGRRRRPRGHGLRGGGLPRHRAQLPRGGRRLRRRDQGENAKNALAFLGGISDPSTQLAFSTAKGRCRCVRDVDVSSLPAYQQASSKSLWSSPVLLSVAHGEAMSPEFQEGFYDAVSTYVRTRDPDAFAADLENAVSQDKIPPR